MKAAKKFCIKMHKKHPERKFVRTLFRFCCALPASIEPNLFVHACLSSLGRKDKYQRNLKKYWVEKEVEGTYEKEVRKDSVRKLTMDMNGEGFEDNDRFGAIDGESHASDSDGVASPKGSDASGSDTDQTSPRPRKRKGNGRGNKEKNKKRRGGGSDGASVSLEEPLEAAPCQIAGCYLRSNIQISIFWELIQSITESVSIFISLSIYLSIDLSI